MRRTAAFSETELDAGALKMPTRAMDSLIVWVAARYARSFDNEGPRMPRNPTLMNDRSESTKDLIRTL